jgi:uncharacterized membrane-anchored protein
MNIKESVPLQSKSSKNSFAKSVAVLPGVAFFLATTTTPSILPTALVGALTPVGAAGLLALLISATCYFLYKQTNKQQIP